MSGTAALVVAQESARATCLPGALLTFLNINHGLPSDSERLAVSDLPSRKPDPGIANPHAGQC